MALRLPLVFLCAALSLGFEETLHAINGRPDFPAVRKIGACLKKLVGVVPIHRLGADPPVQRDLQHDVLEQLIGGVPFTERFEALDRLRVILSKPEFRIWAPWVFEAYREFPLSRRLGLTYGELDQALFWIQSLAISVDPKVLMEVRTLSRAARYFLEPSHLLTLADVLRIDVGRGFIGNRIFDAAETEGWLRTDFDRTPGAQSMSIRYRLMLGFSYNQLQSLLPSIVVTARDSGATSLEFSAVIPKGEYLAPPSFIHIDYGSPEAFFGAAQTFVEWARREGVAPLRIPLTYWIPKTPVHLSVETNGTSKTPPSGRAVNALVLSEAMMSAGLHRPDRFFGSLENRRAQFEEGLNVIRSQIAYRGVHPELWLPIDFANTHEARLEQLQALPPGTN